LQRSEPHREHDRAIGSQYKGTILCRARARARVPGRDFKFLIERALAIMPTVSGTPSSRVDPAGWDSSGCVLEILP